MPNLLSIVNYLSFPLAMLSPTQGCPKQQFKLNLVYMLALRCRCARHIFNSGGMFVAMVTTYAKNCGGKAFQMKFGTYRRWGDKTSYLKNVKCSGEPKNMAALTL